MANDSFTMDDRTLPDLAEENLLRSIECWARAAGGYFFEEDGIHSSMAPVPMRSFNQLIVRRPVSLDEVRGAIGRLGGTERYRLRVRTDIGVDPEVLAEAGLVRQGGIPSMVLQSPVEREIAGLEVREVTDQRTLDDHVALVAVAFDWDSPEMASVFTAKLLADEMWQAWVGYVDGEPVSTAALVTDMGVGGVYYVGTLEAMRGKGYGGLLTTACVNEAARRECRMVGLQASPLGRPVYERLGFRAVAEYDTYVPR